MLGRYDRWTREYVSGDIKDGKTQDTYLGGFAWEQNRNVQWVANVDYTNNEDGSGRENFNGMAYMVTAEVRF